jgi:hypothetical protein
MRAPPLERAVGKFKPEGWPTVAPRLICEDVAGLTNCASVILARMTQPARAVGP